MSDLEETRESVRAALGRAGLADDAVHVAEPRADAPLPPEGMWVVLPTGQECRVGAVGRGEFRTFAALPSADAAAELVVRLLTTRPPSRAAPDGDGLTRAGSVTAEGIRERAASRGAKAGPAVLGPGDALDVLGPETGHHLFALGTPLPARSQPPTDLGEYHRYQVVAPVPDAQEGLAAPWFEQPGGGAMVVLARPVRWYAEEGYLVELV